MTSGGAAFADLVRALAPYLDEIVFIGGWVHALYLYELEGESATTVRTEDIDITLPASLPADFRPTLIELVREAGFDVRFYEGSSGLLEIYRDAVDLDLLTESRDFRGPVEITGQPDLVVEGYPYLDVLRQNTRSMLVGPEVDESLDVGVHILVPTLAAYALGKVLSSASRASASKRAKDLVYLSELLAREPLREHLRQEMPILLTRYPAESELAKEHLVGTVSGGSLTGDVSRQLIEASGYGIEDDSSVRAMFVAQVRRFIAEAWGHDLEG